MYFSSSIFLSILFSMFNTVLFLSQKSYRSVTCSVQMVQAQIIWDTISICSMLGGTCKGNVRQSEISAWRNCRKRGIMPTNNNILKKNPKQRQNHTKNNKTPNQPSKWKKKPIIFIFFLLLPIYTAVIPPLRQKTLVSGAVKGLQKSGVRNPKGKLGINKSSKLSSHSPYWKYNHSGLPGRSSKAISARKKP